MLPTLEQIIRFGPIICGLLAFAVITAKEFKKKKASLNDPIVVGITGSSFPTALLLIWGAFDPPILQKLIEQGEGRVYIAIAGASLLLIVFRTYKERS